MIVTSFTDFELLKKLRTSYLVRIFFDKKRKYHQCFFLSQKQYDKIIKTWDEREKSYVAKATYLIVIDDMRYVWCGIEYSDLSDREWLCNHFNAEYKPWYIPPEITIETYKPARIVPQNTEPDGSLIR